MKYLKPHFLPILVILFSVHISTPTQAQCGLQSGPMAGYSEMREVAIWVQTKCAQEVQLHYWISGHPDTSWFSAPVLTEEGHGFCAHLIANHVTPGNTYAYDILIDQKKVAFPYPLTFVSQSLWQWRMEPHDFTFVAGSCNYVNDPLYDRPGPPYGGDHKIFTAIHQDDPDMMIWLGDNIYLREVDWNTRTGVNHRYTSTRSLPELQPLLASTHHYATWDDHDFGPNDCDGSFWAKDITLQAFKDFWANPNYGVGGTEGVTGIFFWEDCQFFVMDNRWYREPRDVDGDYYGKRQLGWLIEALRYSQASFKFICTGGQILNNVDAFENYAQFADERKILLDNINKYNIKGVVFLTGDRHHSEISRLETADGDVFYDITSSAFTSRTSAHAEEPNRYRVEGSMIGVRNYALISVSGPFDARKCNVVFKDANGAVLYEYALE